MDAVSYDGLRHIFERLHVLDLLAAAKVCKSFKLIAVSVLESRFRHETFCSHVLDEGYVWFAPLDLVNQSLRLFAPRNIQTSGEWMNDFVIVLRLVAEHCPNLEALELLGNIIEPSTFAALHPIFPRLKNLVIAVNDIVYCEINDTEHSEWQLEELCLNGHYSHSLMPRIRMPRLIKLTMRSYNDLDREALTDFVTMNPSIESICFDRCVTTMSNIGLEQLVQPLLQNLRTLSIIPIDNMDPIDNDEIDPIDQID